MMRGLWSVVCVVPFLILATAVPAVAQDPADFYSRFSLAGSFVVAQPKEDFRNNVGNGYGAQGSVLFHLLKSGMVNLRFDVSGVIYDRETFRVPFSETVGGRVLVDVTTTNSIVAFTWAPEFAVPHGKVRPYVNAGYSRLLFRTTSSVSGTRTSDEEIASTTNFKDGTGAWVYSGGVRIPLGSTPASLDLGLRYYRGGEAAYLREGSIFENPDGSISLFPLRSRTPFVMYAVGVQFRIPR